MPPVPWRVDGGHPGQRFRFAGGARAGAEDDGTSYEKNLNFGRYCEGLWTGLHVSGGLGTSDKVDHAALECIVNAADCAAIKACTEATPAQAAACGATTGQACVGDVLVQCAGTPTGGTPTITDCAAGGAHCVASGDTASCGIAACDTATTQASCNDGLQVECVYGVLQSMTFAPSVFSGCSPAGTEPETCTTYVCSACVVESGQVACVGSGAPCDATTFQAGCDGTVVQSCTGGKVGRFDCAQLGPERTCVADPTHPSTFGCGTTGTQCTVSSPESCDGSVLTYCWFGNVATLDCKAYGLSGCTTTTHDGSIWASCIE